MIVVGAIGILWSFPPSSSTESIVLPGDAGVYYLWTVSGQLNGHISGDFSTDGGAVNFYILDSEQYEAYSYDLEPDGSLYSHTGISGSFSVDLPDTSKYYICVDHGTSAEAARTVTVSVEITGISVMFLVGGIVVLAIGVVLTFLGMRMKAKERTALPAPPPPGSRSTDVTMFDTKPKQ